MLKKLTFLKTQPKNPAVHIVLPRELKIIGKFTRYLNTGFIVEANPVKIGKKDVWEIVLSTGENYFVEPFKV